MRNELTLEKQAHSQAKTELKQHERSARLLKESYNKLKQRLLKARSNPMQAEQKTCRKCQKEYVENENYNWSCRTHPYEWGGEMWWCCGQDNVRAAGCLFRKHEPKEDEEEEAEKLENRQRRIIICTCCKRSGHTTDQCPKDPNFRTGFHM